MGGINCPARQGSGERPEAFADQYAERLAQYSQHLFAGGAGFFSANVAIGERGPDLHAVGLDEIRTAFSQSANELEQARWALLSFHALACEIGSVDIDVVAQTECLEGTVASIRKVAQVLTRIREDRDFQDQLWRDGY